jgi:hypothetical protein
MASNNSSRKRNKTKNRKYVNKRLTKSKKRKSSIKRNRKLRGGLIPTSVKNLFTNIGLRSLTNIEEIKNCVISERATPRLFLILQGMRNYDSKMYEYYMPLDTDEQVIKEEKCNRLNSLREEWIEKKNNELQNGRVNTERAILSKTVLDIPIKSTRYFHFLADKYCDFLGDSINKPQICNTYTKAVFQSEVINGFE